MAAPKEIINLVEKFDRNIEAYQSNHYNEAQVRQEFINPFFEELGWDIANTAGKAEAYKDVIHEDAIKVGGATKAPDYCFRIGGVRKFFLEAKKPSVNIKDDVSPAYQLRRYAWSAKLPISVLTDFAEFALYDCNVRPCQNDKASTGRILYLTHKDYIKRWDEIAGIISKDAIEKGLFDKFAAGGKGKRGTSTVDAEFLSEIEEWRDILAKTIALRNTRLSVYDLNFAVQRTIDRILFLRMCEDRGIEPYGQLLGLINGGKIYPRLQQIFERADEKYNSGLFHFHVEKERPEGPDELTPKLAVDDAALKQILSKLYYPQSPYEFSVLPAEILGNVYEQFLGKVIRLTAGHQAKVEEKPEVKKAGGVYYTPSYIVDYIVENTVGKLVRESKEQKIKSKDEESLRDDSKITTEDGCATLKTPAQIAKLRILDPACGSGSFLLGAYTYLLKYHRDWYVANNPEKHTKQIFQGKGSQWFLTIAEKKRILLNNIYGVDIDATAVEVTKLSLLLKVLEGESGETLGQTLKMFHERALPDLEGNIKCGNSLIGSDFYEKQQLDLFDEDAKHKINVFDWQKEFAPIFKQGGFDAVVGNPPYIPIESMNTCEKQYFQNHYRQLQRKYDSSIVFILAMLGKLRSEGYLGFISSVAWQTGENFCKLREHLFNNVGVVSLLNLPFDVFKSAYVDTGIYILSATPTTKYLIYRFPKKERQPNLANVEYTEVSCRLVTAPEYKVVLEPKAQKIFTRLSNNSKCVPLGNLSISTQGLAGNRFKKMPKPQNAEWYPFLDKGQVYRYSFVPEDIVFTTLAEYPSLRPFYEDGPKLLIRRVINRQDRLMATYIDKKMVFKKDINPFVITDSKSNPLFVLGLLNSKLISYLYINSSSIATKDDFRQTTLAELRRLPIVMPSKPQSEKMEKLVNRMLVLRGKVETTKTPNEKTRLQREIDATDGQIDKLVYDLYGLTEEEIRIVEGEE